MEEAVEGAELPLFSRDEALTGQAVITTSTGERRSIPKSKASFGSISSGGLY